MELLPFLVLFLQVQGPRIGMYASELDPNGKHVCRSGSHTQVLTCCSGWKQEGRECTVAVCEGDSACQEEEVCVRPGLCRCKPGFFGANCITRCPDEYWGPDCKERCLCYPYGKCDPASGECTCHPGRWGALCQFACQCGPHGHCSPLTGACHCKQGWWAPDCKKQCQCNLAGSRCDAATGRCLCDPGWWGRKCASPCHCNHSPCAQETGRCECRAGTWGPSCQQQCQCLHGTCSPQDGQCTCDAGYQGQRCTDPCPAGTFGLQCRYRCDLPCPPGLFGKGCLLVCPSCFNGSCDLVSGACVCQAGYWGTRVAAADGDPVSQVKHHVQGALANLHSTFPCFSLGGYKLPRVTVSHHDAEIPFTPSFLEPPSAAWPMDSSFSDTDEDEAPACHLPTNEVPGAQPGIPPEVSALNLEPFAIPRTSSIAKAKRPSVSFAEGTCFGPQSPRGSAETVHLTQKPKAAWGFPQVALFHQGGEKDHSPECCYENVEAGSWTEEGHKPSPRNTPGGPRKRVSGSRHVAQRVEALEAALSAQGKEPGITTIYVTVGKGDGRSRGPEQQLGSLPREGHKLGRDTEGLQVPSKRTSDSGQGTKGQLSQGKPDLEPKSAEAQGLLGSLPAPTCEEAGQNKHHSQSHAQPEVEAGGDASTEESQEPKYENISGLIHLPVAT
ncbi:UNVERIFIED_CONTAM: hypothetical protein K2H54_029440 [Gekko kuhli]